MTPQSLLDSYEANKRVYLREKACGKWDDALTALDACIAACPVDEALPTLALWREEAARMVKPVAWWYRVLGVGR